MDEKRLPFTCPICGRRTEHQLEQLHEGATLTCPFCKVALTLHGHMWEEIQRGIEGLKEPGDVALHGSEAVKEPKRGPGGSENKRG